MRKKLLLFIAAFGAGVLGLAACDQQAPTSSSSSSSGIPESPLNAPIVADFSKEDGHDEVFASDGWSNGQPFNAVWKKENLTVTNNQMHLAIKNGPATADGVEYPYTAGEARTHKLYGHGDFEVRMKPTNVVGSVSTFFTYTDQWNTIDGVPMEHHEIDIEFLGKDTTKVQFNYFVKGQGGHEYMYDLGFDASQAFHNYGFRWARNSITWFVDGVAVYQVTKDNADELPSQPGRIMTSYWPSSATGWSGEFAGPTEATVDYEWIKSSSETTYADADKPVEPTAPFDEDVDWEEVDVSDLTFADGAGYTVAKNEGVSSITYTQPSAWSNVKAPVPEVANASDLFSLDIKNNGPTESEIRIDVQGTKKKGNSDSLGFEALKRGEGTDPVTDLAWGGSKITLGAGEETTLVIHYDITTEKGVATYILVWADSLSDSPAEHEGGNIAVSNFQFASSTGEPIVPPAPPAPPTYDTPILDFEDTTNYVVEKDYETGVSIVTYESIAECTYEYVTAPIDGLVGATDNRLSFKVKNNNETDPAVLILEVRKGADPKTVEIDDYDEWNAEYKQGKVTIPAAGERNVTVAFEEGIGVDSLLIQINSEWAATPATHTNGNVVFSNVATSHVEPEPEPEPDPVVEPEAWKDVALANVTFGSNATYTVAASEGAFRVTYEGAKDWANIDADIRAIANEANDAVILKLTNNAEHETVVRVDVQGQNKVGNTDCLNLSSSVSNRTKDETDTSWGGSKVTLAAKEEVYMVINYDTSTEKGAAKDLLIFVDSLQSTASAAGDITVSNIKFGNMNENVPATPTPAPVDPAPVDPGQPVEEPEGWDEIAVADVAFPSNDTYTVAASEGAFRVTYESAKGWANVDANIAAVANGENDSVLVKLTNNGEHAVEVRVDVQGTTKVGNTDCLNISAAASNRASVPTDAEWGGSKITLAAGEEVYMVITYDTGTSKGAAKDLLIYLDSLQSTESANGGDVTISNVKFGNFSESYPTQAPVDPSGDEPSGDEPEIDENAVALDFQGGTPYTLVQDANKKYITVSYTDIAANLYQPISASVSEIADADKITSIQITLENKGDASAKVRIDALGQNDLPVDHTGPHTAAINVEMTAEGHTDIWTDTSWGGSSITLAAGEKVVVTLTIDQSTERGKLTCINVFFDDFQGDEELRTGTVQISNYILTKAESSGDEPSGDEPSGDEPSGDEPAAVEEPASWADVALAEVGFSSTDTYTVAANEGSFRVTYDSAKNWANIATGISSIANGDNDSLLLKLTNNADHETVVRVDVQGTTKVGNTDCLNLSSVVTNRETDQTDTEWGGSKVTLAANEEVFMVITYDTGTEKGAAKTLLIFLDSLQSTDSANGGDVTISNIKFGNFSESYPTKASEPSGDEPSGDEPSGDDYLSLTFTDDSYGGYTANPAFGTETKSVTVSYVDVGGASYKNIYAAVSPEATANVFNVTLKNNGEAAAKVRVDVKNGSTFLITGESCTGGTDVGNDVIYGGGSHVTLAADEEVVFTINIDQSELVAETVSFYFDSSTYDDEGTHTGSVTISNFEFKTVEAPEHDTIELKFNDTYYTKSVADKDTATDTLTVSYTDLAGGNYENIVAPDVATAANEKTSFNLTVKNNGETAAKVRVDVKSASNAILNTSQSAVGGVATDDIQYGGGSNVEVAAGATATFTVNYDGDAAYLVFYFDSFTYQDANTHSGNVTISGFYFA